MRSWIAASALFLAMAFDAGTGAHAAMYKWCSYDSDGGTNCGFPTRWACQMSVSGAGGVCSINPRWHGDDGYGYRRGHRHRHRHYD